MENNSQKNEHERISVDLMDFFRILRKKAGAILLCMFVFASAAFAAGKKYEEVSYKAATGILILDDEDIDSCVRIAKSAYVLNKAAEKLSADFGIAMPDLKNNVSVSRLQETRQIEILALAPEPSEAEETARTVRDFAIDRINELLAGRGNQSSDAEDKKTKTQDGAELVEVIDDAGEAALTSNINVRAIVLFFALLGFILPAGFLGVKFLMHESTRPVKRPDDIARFLGEEVLAALPERKGNAEKIIKTDDKEKSVCLRVGEDDAVSREAARFLRTNLTALSGAGKVFCFTGTFEGDGTSSAAFYTAKALADADKNVLYIDADTRKAPAGGENGFPGLCELMDGEAGLDDALVKTEYGNLYVMTVGNTSNASSEMFGKAYFRAMLAECRKRYDYVILGTPPIRSCVDSAIIGKECDGTVYVIKSDAVSCALAGALLEQIKKAGCRVTGTVLTGADMENDPYYGKYYHSYREGAHRRAKLIKRR